MRELADYLDAFDERRGRQGLATSIPSGVGPIQPSPPPSTGGRPLPSSLANEITSRVVALLAPTTTPAQAAAVDAQMWALDSRWLASGTWTSMKLCVRQVDAFGPRVATPWAALPPSGCRGVADAVTQPTCVWGFWRINRCDLETASTLVFQLQRYLWAQGRMRDLLANRPRQGLTSAQEASDWLWLASQYVSALLWSTNVRFDNPNPGAGVSYLGDLTRAGLFFAPTAPVYDGPPTGKQVVSLIYGSAAIRTLNYIGDTRTAPTRQSDFSPGTGPLTFMDRGAPPESRPRYAIATSSGPQPYSSQVPIGITNEQAEDIRRAAYAIYSAAGDADGLRWASTKAFNDFWFRATWSWPSKWQVIGDVHTLVTRHVSDGTPAGHSEYSWSSPSKSLAIGGAALLIEQMVQMLEHYSRPSLLYTKWMEVAATAYGVDTSGISAASSPAAMDFVRSRDALIRQVVATSQAAAAASTVPGSTGGDAAMTTALAISLFQSILSLAASSVPLFGGLMAIMQQLGQLLVGAFGGAVGNTPCPAFPFIRVMAPASGTCNLSTEDITASLLGIDSNARWPVSINGQTRTFSVDGRVFTATFGADTTAQAVANRINSAAALVALGAVASVRNGQVHVEGRDPSFGQARATGGTACSLGFPGTCTTAPRPPTPPPTMTTCPDGTSVPAGTTCPPAPSGGGGGLLLGAGALLALRFLLR